ncbi:MAG: hypothetical protein Q9170_000978 [Blastenia crenularia]
MFCNELRIREDIDGLKKTGQTATARDVTTTQCLAEINDLKNEIGSKAHQATAHDQRTFNEVLKGLNQQLQEVRSQIAPKRKFAFKPKTAAASNLASLGTPIASPRDNSSDQQLPDPSKQLGLKTNDSGIHQSRLQESSVLDDVHHALRTENNVEHADQGIIISNSSYCVIRYAVPSPKLTVNTLQTSILVSGPINGAAFVTGVTASVLILSCRQLRMHRCQNCIVYLRCSSRPVIEDCSSIQFAPFPDEVDMTLPEGTNSDHWDQVHDFNWLKAGHSPNWSILEPAKRKVPDQWKRLKTATEDEVDEVLQALGATGSEV